MSKLWMILILSPLVWIKIYSQQIDLNINTGKGVKPVSKDISGLGAQVISGNTYAVVVGISDYIDPDINDLNYGDADAIAFSNYLRSRAGGSLDGDHQKLLVDTAATMAAFASALEWLTTVAKKDDRVIIYFSGHGDIETTLNDEMGFLLCYDASSRVYQAGGALPLSYLQNVISTLSTKNNAKVIFIGDACHSGTLAGSSIGGPRITAEYLKAMKNEIKILSCQPYEFSIEGEQWGGGRGAFSYHLIDALYGLADDNHDDWVTLQEAGWYLERHVSEDVAPVQQVPLVVGERYERLAMVDTFLLGAFKQGKTSQVAMLAPIGSRSEKLILSGLDTNIQRLYKLFELSLKNKAFLEPANASDTGFAELYYQQLIKEPKLEPLYTTLRRNYATALQDDAQRALNSILKVDVNEITRSKLSKIRKYKNYPLYLNRAAELLGEDHFFYKKLKARQYFFEGLLLFWANSGNKNYDEGQKIMDKYRLSLEYESIAAHTYFYMMYCEAYKFENKDSAEYFAFKASNNSPGWILPFTYLAYFYSNKLKDSIRAKIYLDKAMQIDSLNTMVIFTRASWHYYKGDIKEANVLYQIVANRDSTNAISRLNLGIVNLKLDQYEIAKKYLLEYIKLDSAGFQGYHFLAIALNMLNDEKGAEQNFLKAIEINPNYINGLRELAKLYRKQKRNQEAEFYFRKLLTFEFDKKPGVYYELACLMALKNHIDESLEFFEKAFKAGFMNFDAALNNEELKEISNSDAFKNLILKYKK
jgi:Tfp pilus assembly protein PilF